MACLWFTPGEPQIPPLIGSFRIHPQMLFSGIRALDASCKARLKFWVSGRLLESRRSKLDSPVGPAAYGLTGLRAIPRPMPRPMPRPASGTHAHAVTPPLKPRPCLSSPRDACARRDSTPSSRQQAPPRPTFRLVLGTQCVRRRFRRDFVCPPYGLCALVDPCRPTAKRFGTWELLFYTFFTFGDYIRGFAAAHSSSPRSSQER